MLSGQFSGPVLEVTVDFWPFISTNSFISGDPWGVKQLTPHSLVNMVTCCRWLLVGHQFNEPVLGRPFLVNHSTKYSTTPVLGRGSRHRCVKSMAWPFKRQIRSLNHINIAVKSSNMAGKSSNMAVKSIRYPWMEPFKVPRLNAIPMLPRPREKLQQHRMARSHSHGVIFLEF